MGKLNLWKALYEPGDLVWIFTDYGIFPGEIVSVHLGPSGMDTRARNGKGYLHYTGKYTVHSLRMRMAKSKVPGTASKGSLMVRATQIIPREGWEQIPLERVSKIIASRDLLDKYTDSLQGPGTDAEGKELR